MKVQLVEINIIHFKFIIILILLLIEEYDDFILQLYFILELKPVITVFCKWTLDHVIE